MTKRLPHVTVFTMTYNQCEIVRNTVLDLFAQDYDPALYEVVVLIDGSNDGTRETLASLQKRCPVRLRMIEERHDGNYLSARRWNQCIRTSAAETEVFIQIDDVRVRRDFLYQHVKWHIRADDYVVTGAKFEGPIETWDLSSCRRSKLAGPGSRPTEGVPFSAVWGASLSYTRRAMWRACTLPSERPYDESMEGWGYHEVEFAYRLTKKGVRTVYDPGAGVFHQDHTRKSESLRGMDRSTILNSDTSRNIDFILTKHSLTSLPHW